MQPPVTALGDEGDASGDSAAAAILASRLLPPEILRRLRYFRRTLRAAAYARQNIDRRITLDEVAAFVGMHRCAFSRYFTAKIGITFSEFLRVVRVEFALDDLQNGDDPIDDLARDSGYQRRCTFSRAFKRVVGKTPSEYRRHRMSGLAERADRAV